MTATGSYSLLVSLSELKVVGYDAIINRRITYFKTIDNVLVFSLPERESYVHVGDVKVNGRITSIFTIIEKLIVFSLLERELDVIRGDIETNLGLKTMSEVLCEEQPHGGQPG